MHDVNLWPLIAIVIAIASQVYKWSKKQAPPQSPAAVQQAPQMTAAQSAAAADAAAAANAARVAAAARAVLTARTAPVNVTLSSVPPPSPQPRPPAAPRPVTRPMAASVPVNQSGFQDAVLTGSPRSFLHDAFGDPAHARRAIILSELLLPPIALR